MINCTIINNDTGEILTDNYNIDELKDKERKRKAVEKKITDEKFKQLQQEYFGNFVFFIFKNLQELTKILTDTDLVKFIYIGTFVKNDGSLKLDNNLTFINKKKLKDILRLGDKSFSNFFNIITKNNLLKEDNDRLYINLDCFYRGRESDYKKLAGIKLEDFTRLYIKTTRELYSNTPIKQHGKLAIAYKLLPYVNWKYNILCTNINEIDKSKVQALSIEDVLKIINYSKNQLSRFKKMFYSIKSNEYQLFKTIQGDSEYTNSMIIVNPMIYYRGGDFKELTSLINLFDLKTIKDLNKIHNK